MSIVQYPKILIVGHYPGEYTGVSITLKNLFANWPPERLAVASMSSFLAMQSGMCNNYYMLGNSEVEALGILRHFYKISKSKSYVQSEQRESKQISNKHTLFSNSKKIFYASFLKPLLTKTGLLFVRFSYRVSSEFTEWISSQEIDIIFTMLGDVSSMRFARELKQCTGKQLAIYILDDWIHAHPKHTIFPQMWSRVFRPLFQKLVNEADIRMTCSKKMALEYQAMYGKDFKFFHNPVDLSRFVSLHEFGCDSSDRFKISYLGKINKDTIDGLLDLIVALDMVKEHRIVLNVYPGKVGGETNRFIKLLAKSKYLRIMPYVDNANIPEVLISSNLLFLPLGFSKESREYTRLSMPTKISEYMASKVPILLYAPNEIALTEYAIHDKWAISICKRSVPMLADTISSVFHGRIDVNEFVENAYRSAFTNHQADIVKEEFRKALSKNVINEI